MAPLLENLAASTSAAFEPLFLVSPDDTDELAAIDDTDASRIVVPWDPGQGDYARKINLGAQMALALSPRVEFVFLAADDLCFHDGWAEQAVDVAHATGALVVGTNDLGNPGTIHGIYSTHSLVNVSYVSWGTVDRPGERLYHDGYSHNGCDAEFCATARHRLVYEHARQSVVEHLHPVYGKADDDATYRKGRAAVAADDRLVSERCARYGLTRA